MDGGTVGRRTRIWPLIFLVSIVTCMAAAAGWWFATQTIDSKQAGMPIVPQEDFDLGKQQVHLYFRDAQAAFLRAETRTIRTRLNSTDYGRQIVTELIKGPKKESVQTLPEHAKIKAFYITASGTAYIDFAPDAFVNYSGGIESELISIYSVVNSLILNSDIIRSVQFIIGGRQVDTLAGHIDISRPLTANMLIVR